MKTPHLKLDLASCRFVLHDGRHRVVAGPIAGSLLAVLAAYALRGPGGDEPAVQAAQGRLEASPGPPATPAPTKNFGRFIRERPTLMVKMLPKSGPNLKAIGRLVYKPRVRRTHEPPPLRNRWGDQSGAQIPHKIIGLTLATEAYAHTGSYILTMANVLRLQKIGNSFRATVFSGMLKTKT